MVRQVAGVVWIVALALLTASCGVPAVPTESPAPGSTTVRPTTVRPTTVRPTTVQPTTVRPTTTASPVCRLPAPLKGEDLTRVPTTGKVVALTFDGGASSEGVASILETLDSSEVPATFFLTGDFADAHPGTARTIASRHPIGNHTQNHPDLTTLGDSAVRREIRTGAASIQAVTGEDPHPWFRFPYGAVDDRVIRLANAECYVPFRWTVDTLGWKGTSGGQSASTVTRRVLDGLRPGAIVLMHVGANPDDHSTLDADALPGMIEALQERGYGFVTLEAALPDAG